jgi:peptidoglycan hydrolase-like protein with peptidoglycan-binding domain
VRWPYRLTVLSLFTALTGCGSASWHLSTIQTAGAGDEIRHPVTDHPAKPTDPSDSSDKSPSDALVVRPSQVRFPVLQQGDHSAAVTRLQQILARLGYLPVSWSGQYLANDAYGDELTALTTPPKGNWAWRYAATPASLRSLWSPGDYTVLVKGAVMTFQEVHHLTIDGVAGPDVWQALIQADMNNERCPYNYSYVYVSKDSPERLTLWENGRVILTSPANTGVSAAPTPNGTWPVYLRLRSQTMRGRNPDGSEYVDEGVPYISYFYKGDAVHGFVRDSYGSPQSVGCVELPLKQAQEVWEHMHYGTLVTVSN